MNAIKKIEAMHNLFGETPGKKCKDCIHLKGSAGNYRKCKIYGDSASEATDWTLRSPACGLFNKNYTGDIPVYKTLKNIKQKDLQCDGQAELQW